MPHTHTHIQFNFYRSRQYSDPLADQPSAAEMISYAEHITARNSLFLANIPYKVAYDGDCLLLYIGKMAYVTFL